MFFVWLYTTQHDRGGVNRTGITGTTSEQTVQEGRSNTLHTAVQTWNVLESHNQQYEARGGWGVGQSESLSARDLMGVKCR